jgi:hypothetical protein
MGVHTVSMPANATLANNRPGMTLALDEHPDEDGASP